MKRLSLLIVLLLSPFFLAGCQEEPVQQESNPPRQTQPRAPAPTDATTRDVHLRFSGGPEGGTFQYFSNGISTRLTRSIEGVSVTNIASAGSVENIRRVNSGEVDMGIAYSGDTYLARNAHLVNDPQRYENVHALAFLYGAPAHLVVQAESGIREVHDLAGKRIAVGGAGSGAAAAAQRYFGALEIWSKMKIEFIGYSKAAEALHNGQIDAMWVFAGAPNSAVIQAATRGPIRLIDTLTAARESGLFEQFPFYGSVTIPAGTYQGIDSDVQTFQDAALWIANRLIDETIVEESLQEIFSEAGLSYMVKVKSTAAAMSADGALSGIVIPVHRGARTYWRARGLTLSEAQSQE